MKFKLSYILSILTILLTLSFTSKAEISPVEQIFLSVENDSLRFKNFTLLIDTISDCNDREKYSVEFLETAFKYKSDYCITAGYLCAGYCSVNNGNINEGLNYSFKGLAYADSLNYKKFRITLLLNISSFLSEINDIKGSFFYIQRAQEYAEEINDYSNLIDIYYNIAFFYIDQELYESSIKYFKKAQIYTSLNDISSASELAFTISSLQLKILQKNADTLNALRVSDSLNAIINRVENIGNAVGIVNYCITMIECNLKDIEYVKNKKANYLKFARKYLDIMKISIDTSQMVQLYAEVYNAPKANYLVSCGNYSAAWNLLSRADNFNNNEEYIKALYNYYCAINQYDEALKYFWKSYYSSFKNHPLEYTVHYERSQSRTDYETKVAELESMADIRNSNFVEEKKFNSKLNIASITIIVLFIVMVYILTKNLYENNKKNANLESNNVEIASQNLILSMQRGKIMNQIDKIKSQNAIILEQSRDLSSFNTHIKASIKLAQDIQKALIVSPSKLKKIVGDSFVMWQPLNVVSGDFYWAATIEDKSYLAVADCTGHGVPGALLSMYGISMLNDHVRRNYTCNAAKILEILKSTFLKTFQRGNNEFYDGIDMAMIILDRNNMNINYSGAKRPLIIVRDGEVLEYNPDKISIGNNPIRKNDTFTNYVIDINKDDMIYAFSDGIADQFGDEDCTTKFGNRQLHNILSEISYLETPMQKNIIESVVDNWRTGTFFAGLSTQEVPQLDDQLLIGVRI